MGGSVIHRNEKKAGALSALQARKVRMADQEWQCNVKQVCLLVIVLCCFIVSFFPVWKGLFMVWCASEEYSHGFFIVPLCLYILWRKKAVLAETPISTSMLGLVLVMFSLLLYIFAHYAEISTVRSFSMVLLFAGVVIYFYGFYMFKELLFPLFLLLFMIPVPAQIYAKLTVPLQLFVSKISTWLAAAFGLPIYREGNVIHLADRNFQVVQACSGLRSMISLLTLSAIFAYFTLRSNFLRAILFFSAIPAAIFVNIIRVLLMVLVYHFFTYDLTKGSVHTVFGLVIFLLALAFLVGVRGVLSIWDSS
jgi:exosortase